MADRAVREGQRERRHPIGQGVVLSERPIVDTALRLVVRHGAEALSARRPASNSALSTAPSATRTPRCSPWPTN
ncbi:hypothetical protein ACFC5Z_23460 [Streptomyces sp. NPDC056004]|uniref:hypothetical protein n=1 Tax=unclassified Streptomyces TaxID=2593676 RepID=UPI0035E18E4B